MVEQIVEAASMHIQIQTLKGMRAKFICNEFKGFGESLMKQSQLKHDEKVQTSIEPCEEPGKLAECLPKNTKVRQRAPVVQVKKEDVNVLKSIFSRRATKLFMNTKTGPSVGGLMSPFLTLKKQASESSNVLMDRYQDLQVSLVTPQEVVLSKEEEEVERRLDYLRRGFQARDQMERQDMVKKKLIEKIREDLLGDQLKQIEEKKRNVIAQAKRQSSNQSEFQGLTTDFNGFPMLSKIPPYLQRVNQVVSPSFQIAKGAVKKKVEWQSKKVEKENQQGQNLLKVSDGNSKESESIAGKQKESVENSVDYEEAIGLIDKDSKLQALLELDNRFNKRRNELILGSQNTNTNIKLEPGVNLTYKDTQISGGEFCLSPKMVYKNLAKEQFERPARKLAKLAVSESDLRKEILKTDIVSHCSKRLLSHKTQASRNSCQQSHDKILIQSKTQLGEMLDGIRVPSNRSFALASKSTTPVRQHSQGSIRPFSAISGNYTKLLLATQNLKHARKQR